MPGVVRKTESLVTAIQQSDEYINYSKLRRELAQETGVQNRIDAFRRQVFLLQNDAALDSFAKDMETLQHEYADVLSKPKVMAFLAAEKAFVNMMKDVYERIDHAVPFDLSFLQE